MHCDRFCSRNGHGIGKLSIGPTLNATPDEITSVFDYLFQRKTNTSHGTYSDLSQVRRLGFPKWLSDKKPKQEMWIWFRGWEDPLEKEMETHSSILAWEIPWTEEPGGLQSMGSQRVRHDLSIKQEIRRLSTADLQNLNKAKSQQLHQAGIWSYSSGYWHLTKNCTNHNESRQWKTANLTLS